MSTSLDQNFSDLANILMQRRQMQNQQAQQERANRLSDLQMRQLQREEDYQTGLQGAMASPGVITSRQIAPNPQPSLANLMPESQMQPSQFEQPVPQVGPLASRVQTTETPRSAAAAGAEYALGKGRFEDAVKLLSVDDHVAQLKAKGDLPSYYQAQRELEEGNKFFDIVSKYKSNPEQLKMLWPQIQRLFPQQSAGITPDDVQFKGKSVLIPLEMNGQIVPDKGVFRDDQGKNHIVDLTPKEQPETWSDPYQMKVGGKLAMVQKSSKGQIKPVVQDTSTTVKVSAGVKGEKDIPVGIQEKLQGKIELANDWGKLRDTFNPSFVPKTKFKTLAEFETNIQRVFSGNQPAIDWWMGYFDARNILMKDRSGAAVTEPEFRRFEQGAIRANDSPKTIINQLNRAAGKYEGHAESFIGANEKNHPQGIKAFTEGMGYQRKKAKGGKKDPLGIL